MTRQKVLHWLFGTIIAVAGGGCSPANDDNNVTVDDLAPGLDGTADSLVSVDGVSDSRSPEGDSAGPLWEAKLTLPEYPFWPNDGLAVAEEQLQGLADGYCHVRKEAGKAPDFFYGVLPLRAVAELCPISGPGGSATALSDPEQIKTLLGWMYLSGYYGGVWFRDNADFGMGMPSGEGGGPEPGPVAEEDFRAIADNAKFLREMTTSGAAADLYLHNLEALNGTGSMLDALMTSLLTIFAYNYGYVQAVLAKPPEGVIDVPAFPCKDYLSCKLASGALGTYAAYESALDHVKAKATPKWEEVAASVEKSKTWIGIGKGLWSQGSISPEAWGILVTINAGYLQVSAAAALASMLGYGESDEAAGRCGALLEAAADTWNQAYFLALRSDAPVGSAPALLCEAVE